MDAGSGLGCHRGGLGGISRRASAIFADEVIVKVCLVTLVSKTRVVTLRDLTWP
jgi:hypothetical protein